MDRAGQRHSQRPLHSSSHTAAAPPVSIGTRQSRAGCVPPPPLEAHPPSLTDNGNPAGQPPPAP